jgi:hypothetical protein
LDKWNLVLRHDAVFTGCLAEGDEQGIDELVRLSSQLVFVENAKNWLRLGDRASALGRGLKALPGWRHAVGAAGVVPGRVSGLTHGSKQTGE